jgi:ubiquinone/menaquinone biosynthesis C-methylase UbiE
MVFDGERIPYADDRFDLAIMSHVVEHVEHPRQLIKEAARVARYVFVEVPMEDNIRLPPDFMIDKVGHINFYSPKTLRRLIQTCGLSVLSQITTNASKDVHSYYGGVRGRINFGIKECLLKIAPNISPWLFTYHGSLLCTRTSSLR